jgi:hypothetical protein
VISDLEWGMDDFYRDFGTDRKNALSKILADASQSDFMEYFLTYYSWEIIAMLGFIMSDILFLLLSALLVSIVIFYKINTLDSAANGGDLDVTTGFKLALFGMLFGTVNYLAGTAVEF